MYFRNNYQVKTKKQIDNLKSLKLIFSEKKGLRETIEIDFKRISTMHK